MIVVAQCPACAGDVGLKHPGTPGRQAVYCSRRCHDRAAKRRQRGRQLTVLEALSDAQLVCVPHAALAFYGVEFDIQTASNREAV